ncbi:MAG: site-specific DNA-methyltransferase [Proteobacteria bacterium]|nr:site-specific DNA-methyltransferase [Pseudomonadota bacterium]
MTDEPNGSMAPQEPQKNRKSGDHPDKAGAGASRPTGSASRLADVESRHAGIATMIRCEPIDSVRQAKRRTRKHAERQIQKLMASIMRFGMVVPLLVGEDFRLVSGHARWEAARRLGYREVPVIVLSHLSEDERRALAVGLKRIAEESEWDEPELVLELTYLVSLDELEVMDAIGFDLPEIEVLVDGKGGAADQDPADAVPELAKVVVSRAGDLWRCGNHLIYCGNALDGESYGRLLKGEKARLVFTDPPYNVPIGGNVSGLGKVRHREFAMASGEMSVEEFIAFLKAVLTQLAEHSMDGALSYVCMDWRHMHELLMAGREAYSDLVNLAVWVKDNGGMGSFYRSRHELVAVWKAGHGPILNNVQLGRFGRNRSNVWEYPGVNSFKTGRLDELAMHPTVKPVALVADAIRDASNRGDIVLDAFSGSGTTLIAADKTGRIARVIELDPAYVDVAIRRFEALTGAEATHAEIGETFATVADKRAVEAPADADNDNQDVPAPDAAPVRRRIKPRRG